MNRFIPYLLLLASQVVGAESTNAPTRSLSLLECIRLAVEHNFDVKIEQKGVDIARQRLSQAYADYDPVLRAGAKHGHSLSPGGLDATNGVLAGTRSDSDSLTAGLGGLLPTGLTYDLGLELVDAHGTAPPRGIL